VQVLLEFAIFEFVMSAREVSADFFRSLWLVLGLLVVKFFLCVVLSFLTNNAHL